MKFISHRGNLNGPDKIKENHPDQIQLALDKGFSVEIDIWCVKDNYWLGHDEPTYEIHPQYLRNKKLWIHCKNVRALSSLVYFNSPSNYFWHQNDDVVLTSHGYMWTFPGKELAKEAIAVMPEVAYSFDEIYKLKCIGFCSDWIEKIRDNIKQPD
jgi:hypothetical protein